MASRLEVLSRQMTAGGMPTGDDIFDLSGVCPQALGRYLVHDNPELRAAIFEFLKASRGCMDGCAGNGAVPVVCRC